MILNSTLAWRFWKYNIIGQFDNGYDRLLFYGIFDSVKWFGLESQIDCFWSRLKWYNLSKSAICLMSYGLGARLPFTCYELTFPELEFPAE